MSKYLLILGSFAIFGAAMQAATPRATPFMRGFCHEDPNNKGFFLLKTLDMPGWQAKDKCYAKDFTVSTYGKKDCLGGSLDECKTAGVNLYRGMP